MASPYPLPTPEGSRASLRVIRDEAATGFAMIPCDVLATGDGPCIAVYAVLAKHADRDGVCWPSVQTLCDALGWSRKVVEPAMKRLIEGGLVVKERRQLHGMDQSSRYRISANGRVVPIELAVVPTAPLGSSHGTSGSFPQNDEQEPLEPKPNEQDGGDPPTPPSPAKKPRPVKAPDYSPEFLDRFWAGYPVQERNSRSDSFRLWERMSPEERESAIAALPLFVASRGWREGFVPGAQVWLRGRRWEDPPKPQPTNGVHAPPPRSGGAAKGGLTPDEIMAYGRRRQDDLRRNGANLGALGSGIPERSD